MIKCLRFLIGLLAAGVILVSGWHVVSYLMESHQNSKINDDLAEGAVIIRDPEPAVPEQQESSAEKTEEEAEESKPVLQPPRTSPLEVNFQKLWEKNGDIIAWIYSDNSPINYPIVQAKDNDYYLRRLINGNYNIAGTLFADYENAPGFTDGKTFVYGHNMKNGSMFGTLTHYRKQEYYDTHPVIWLMTPEQDYKVEVAAGFSADAQSDVYLMAESDEKTLEFAQQSIANSTFQSGIEPQLGDKWILLSTCSYETETARYVLMGRLVPFE